MLILLQALAFPGFLAAVLCTDSQGPSQLTHLPVLHEEDMQWVQGAEVEDINVVLHSHLGMRVPSQFPRLDTLILGLIPPLRHK